MLDQMHERPHRIVLGREMRDCRIIEDRRRILIGADPGGEDWFCRRAPLRAVRLDPFRHRPGDVARRLDRRLDIHDQHGVAGSVGEQHLERRQIAGGICIAFVAAPSAVALPPNSASRSTARMPSPPPLVRIVRFFPAGARLWPSSSTQSNNSRRSNTRSRPARRNAASYTASLPASAPVWVSAAFAPCAMRPDLTTTTGLSRAAARAADMNLRASLTASTYSRIAWVPSSSAK